MPAFHCCVWIDQRHAKILEIEPDTFRTVKFDDPRSHHHLHRRANHVGLGTIEMNPALLTDVGHALEGAKAVLVLGPGKARTVLADFLEEHFQRVAACVWGNEACDHPTDPELVARARAFFRSADRMHALGESR